MSSATRKVVVHRPGGRSRLQIEACEAKPPGLGEVQIDVAACGVNYADCVVRMGLYSSAKRYVGWPITPGFEVAGAIAAVGAGVDDLEVGAPVVAVTRFGGYATTLTVPRRQVMRRPTQLSAVEAAALPAAALTAWYALHKVAAPPAGAPVLIHSAAGGVGGMLVQLCRAAGCDVVGVVGAGHKVAVVERHGARAVIDKSREDLWALARRCAPDGYAAIFDANGVSTLRESYEHLAPTGRLVIYGFHSMLPRDGRVRWLKLAWHFLRTPRFSPLRLTQENRGVLGFNLSYLFDQVDLLAAGLTGLSTALASGALAPPEVTTFAFDDVAAAHAAIESGQTTGKLALVV